MTKSDFDIYVKLLADNDQIDGTCPFAISVPVEIGSSCMQYDVCAKCLFFREQDTCCSMCDLKYSCRSAFDPYNVGCAPKIDCLEAK